MCFKVTKIFFKKIPGGWLAHKFGGKKLVAFSMLLGSILTLLVPWTSNLGLYSVIICRFLTGFVHVSSLILLFILDTLIKLIMIFFL